MATQTATISVSASVSSVKGGRSTTAGLQSSAKRVLGYGTTVDTADRAYYGLRTVTSSVSSDTLDLAGGSLIDLNGDPVTFVEVTTLIIANLDTTNTLTVGGNANKFNFGSGSGTKTLKPGERVVLIDLGVDPGYTVTPGTGDIIEVATSGGSNVSYEIIIVGRSA